MKIALKYLWQLRDWLFTLAVSCCLTVEYGRALFRSSGDRGEIVKSRPIGQIHVQFSRRHWRTHSQEFSFTMNVNIRGYMVISNMDAHKISIIYLFYNICIEVNKKEPVVSLFDHVGLFLNYRWARCAFNSFGTASASIYNFSLYHSKVLSNSLWWKHSHWEELAQHHDRAT